MNSIFSLSNKTILVTGASSGIGRATAIALSKLGAKLIITGRNIERLKETHSLLVTESTLICCDMANKEEIDHLVSSIDKIDGLVNVAGITQILPFKFMTEKSLDSILDLNFKSSIFLTQKLLKNKKINKNSSIVFVSSISGGIVASLGHAAYSASKGAIAALSKVLALELSAQKIRVNCVSPGMVRTELLQTMSITEEQFLEDEKKYPLGYGEPEDVANTISFLISDASKWMTGANLILDGGFSIQ